MKITPAVARACLRVLAWAAEHAPPEVQADAVEARNAFAFQKEARKAKRLDAVSNRRAEELLRWAQVKTLVLERANGTCENPFCGDHVGWARLVADHWLGGSGRRRAEESVETVWALCFTCNQNRTENRPDARYWNAANRAHCDRHGYQHHPHKEVTTHQQFQAAVEKTEQHVARQPTVKNLKERP